MTKAGVSTLIKTKLLAPLNRSGMVDRTRLLALLQSAIGKKLILVSAPAGFGKTTLLGQWFEALREKAHTPCWLSLDANDNDPETFLRYLVAALQQVDKKIGQEALHYVDNAPSPDISRSLGTLVNELIQVEGEVVLFLDDFHLITSPEINQYMELLVNLSPPHFHILISGRTLPELPLASMRVRNDLVQIAADKLRFDTEESESFLLKSRELRLNKAQLTTLYERCEGWAAGLQLASLSLREAEDQDRFIQQFSGNIRDVTDYLAAAVLAQQPDSVRTFLVGTAILDRLNADLCNHLLARDDAHDLLQKLESDNLFIVPLDQERKWYRYHPLFQEFLLAQLAKDRQADLNDLNDSACHWFKEQGYLREAVDYALRADNMAVAAELIENRAVEEFRDGRMPQVAAWINRIPKQVRLQHPKLMLLQGTSLYHMNRADEADYVCCQLEQRVSEMVAGGEVSAREQGELIDEIAILRAGISMSMDNASDVIQGSPRELHSHQDFMEGVINNVKGYSYYVLGDFQAAREHISLARQAHRQINSSFGLTYSDCFLGMLEYAQGNLKRAQQVFDQIQPSPVDAIVHSPYSAAVSKVMRGVIRYEMNDLDSTLELLQPNLKTLEQVGHISLMHLGYITLAKYFAANDDYETGLRVLDHLSGLYPHAKQNLNHQLLVGYHRIKLQLRNGRRSEALKLASLLDITLDEALPELPGKWSREAFQRQLIQARLWLAAGQLEPLISVARRLYELARQIGLGYRALECLLLLSRAYLKSGDEKQAVAAMKLSLEQAAVNDILRIFVDEGEGIVPIIRLVQRDTTQDDPVLINFIGAVLTAFEADRDRGSQRKRSGGEAAGLVEPLSQRELDVLKLMGEGKSNAVIADKLHISENTVKWHGRNMFGKLGVKNRTEAVITAQEMGLVDSL